MSPPRPLALRLPARRSGVPRARPRLCSSGRPRDAPAVRPRALGLYGARGGSRGASAAPRSDMPSKRQNPQPQPANDGVIGLCANPKCLITSLCLPRAGEPLTRTVRESTSLEPTVGPRLAPARRSAPVLRAAQRGAQQTHSSGADRRPQSAASAPLPSTAHHIRPSSTAVRCAPRPEGDPVRGIPQRKRPPRLAARGPRASPDGETSEVTSASPRRHTGWWRRASGPRRRC